MSHLDTRYNEGLSWGRSFDAGEFSFGGYLRQEALTGLGIDRDAVAEHRLVLRSRRPADRERNAHLGRSLRRELHDLRKLAELAARPEPGYRIDERRAVLGRHGIPAAAARGTSISFRRCSWTASSSPIPRQGRWTPTAWRPTATPTRIRSTPPSTSWASRISFRARPTSTSRSIARICATRSRTSIPAAARETFCNSKLGFAYEIPINIGNAVYEGAEARYKQRFPRQNLTMTLSYGLNVAYPYALGPWVSNPTSGGTLVDSQQFLGVPQQQGSAVFTLGAARLARVDRVYVCRQQQHAQPAALHALRSGGRQEFRSRRYHGCRDKYLQLGGRPVYPLRCRHALSGTLFDLEQRPVPGQLSHRCIVRPTGIGKVHRHPSYLNALMKAARLTAVRRPATPAGRGGSGAGGSRERGAGSRQGGGAQPSRRLSSRKASIRTFTFP